MATPDEPPPSYDAATASSSISHPAGAPSQRLSPDQARNGIPPHYRRSMEDEGRPLPSGWLRQYDEHEHHQFFVDTNKDPPRSIWHHPYDDDEYMNSLDAAERKRIQGLHQTPSQADIVAMSSDEEDHHPAKQNATPTQSKPEISGGTRFGRRLKDKLTNSTHEQREAERRQRAIQEQQAYEQHQQFRRAMARSMETGEPQFIGKDRDGKDMYIEPPGMAPRGNPYLGQGAYSNPNARYFRPQYPYRRPYGGGYGGGLGLPLAGGLMGGLLIGDMMGGGLGGGFGGGGM